MIVLDASAALEILLGTPASAPIADRVLASRETLHAPHLIDAEVLQIIRRYWLSGEIDAERGREAANDLADLSLERYPHHPLLPRMWDLRDNATAYDAAYLTLAEALGAPLVTCDARLARAAGAAGVEIEIEQFPASGGSS